MNIISKIEVTVNELQFFLKFLHYFPSPCLLKLVKNHGSLAVPRFSRCFQFYLRNIYIRSVLSFFRISWYLCV